MRRILLAAVALVLLAGAARAQERAAVLDSIQYAGFRYFWYTANPANGLCPDRSTPGSVCSIASTGFGLSALCVGADHGWITREQAARRTLTTLRTFWWGAQGPATSGVIGYQGLFYHWLDMNTATRRVDWNSELSTIDTALLFAGIVHCREYFSVQGDSLEDQIRALADSITWRADWSFVLNSTTNAIRMGWNPSTGFSGFGDWIGYNEAMIMYVLAIGSPTHPVPGSSWNSWTSGYQWGSTISGGAPYVKFAPLFGHQYSHCWIDFRGILDLYMLTRGANPITYFENSRRATLSQLSYARANGVLEQQFGVMYPSLRFGESDSLWGFTASDDPSGYVVHGAPGGLDNGTITPTAAISSYPFAPDSIWPCIRNLWNTRNTTTLNPYGTYSPGSWWGPYGFGDAFNPVRNPWVTTAVLGIDQGPIVLMLENARNNMVWARFMQNADIQRGLAGAGFQAAVTGVDGGLPPPGGVDLALDARPNPFRSATTLHWRLGRAAHVNLSLFDLQGRRVSTLVDADRAAGEHTLSLDGAGLAAGVYLCRLEADGARVVRRAVVLP
jgi:hypothetical protein